MTEFEPTWDSLDSHAVPEWFHDAKLGIFVHWGVYSVPAWAPTDAEIGGEDASPYAEWYPYFMYEEGSPTREYHREHYGADVEYLDFVPEFTAENWDPGAWADLFSVAGAGYVVLTGEHHDGFPLWDSHYARYNAAEVGPERDLVGDLCEAVRDRGLRFGASYHANYNYYQPGFKGRFGHPDFGSGGPGDEEGGPGTEYVDFMNAKHRELIRTYEPDLLWFDVPKADSDHLRARELIAEYYNGHDEVAVNDRASTDAVGPTIDPDNRSAEFHGDFLTPEYASFDSIGEEKWEACRGIGGSFGYNRAESEEDHLAPGELVRSFVDVVSKNGNLLLNVGPRADGTIPEIQRERLEALGGWLSINGEAIVGSRPWVVAEDAEGEVRYTWRGGDLYATALSWPNDRLELPELDRVEGTPSGAAVLAAGGELACELGDSGGTIAVELPDEPDHDHAYAIRLTDVSNPRQR